MNHWCVHVNVLLVININLSYLMKNSILRRDAKLALTDIWAAETNYENLTDLLSSFKVALWKFFTKQQPLLPHAAIT